MALSLHSTAHGKLLRAKHSTRSSSRRSSSIHAAPQFQNAQLGIAAGLSSAAALLLADAASANVDPASLAASLDVIDTTTAIAGASVAAVGSLVAVAFGQGGEKKAGLIPTTAKLAWEALNADENTVLVDIRAKSESKETGVPDLKPANKKLLSLAYTQVKKTKEGPEVIVNEKFAASFAKLKGLKEESIIILVDKDGSQASAAAKLLLASDLAPKKVYYVKGGTDAWQATEDLPWQEPAAPFQLTLPSLELLATVSQTVQGTVSEGVGKAAATVKANQGLIEMGLTAAAGVGGAVFLITEFELLLQLVGVAAATTFLARNVLDGKLREGTFEALKSFFTDKIAADEVGDDLKKLARAILDAPDSAAAARSIQALDAAAPVAALPGPSTPANPPTPVATTPAAPPAVVVPAAPAAALAVEEPAAPAAGPAVEEPAAVVVAEPAAAAVVEEEPAAEAATAATEAPVDASAVPENVQEAREWIAAWKAVEAAPTAAEATEAPAGVPENVQEAREWIAAWKVEAVAPAGAEATEAPAEVPENVQEAREWIAAWKAEAVAPAEPAATESSADVPDNVKEAREWIAGWKAEQAVAVEGVAPAVEEVQVVVAAEGEAEQVAAVVPEKELQTVSA